MEKKNKLVFTATYNERSNVESFCEQVLALPNDYDLLIVDDNSPDGTGEVLKTLQKENNRLKIIHRPRKLGLGTAHKLAMQFALRHNYDILITMDADFSHNPQDIPRLEESLENVDFVIGSRYMEGGSTEYVGYRRTISVVANFVSSRLLNLPFSEMTTSFRCFRVSLLRLLNFRAIHSEGYGFFLESIFRINRAGFRCREIPINFLDRKEGVSKIPRFEIFNGMLNLTRLFLASLSGKHEEPCNSEQLPSCYFCKSPYVAEQFKEQSPKIAKTADDYRCTSMAHRNKPKVVSCLVCGLSYAPQRLHDKSLESTYKDVVDAGYIRNKDARIRTFEKSFDKISRFLPLKPGRILEIGSYCGFFGQVAKERGWEYVGIELSSWATKYAQDSMGLDVREGNLTEFIKNYHGEPFDVIVMWDVIEHLQDPIKDLTQAHGLLQKQGLLFFSTIVIDSWFARLLGARWPWIMEMHLFYFSIPTLKLILEKSGFRLEEHSNYIHYASFRYLLDKISVLVTPLLGWLLFPVKILFPKSWLIPVAFGDVRQFVCRKEINSNITLQANKVDYTKPWIHSEQNLEPEVDNKPCAS